jgi:outer membrane protein assembly factor BamB
MTIILTLAVLASHTALSAHDWPMYGGSPTRNAVAPGDNPPRSWGVDFDGTRIQPTSNIKWMAEVGHGFSLAAPVIADGFVWVGTNNDNPRDPNRTEPAPTLMCFRESDGVFVWQYLAPVPRGLRADVSWTGIKCSPWIEGDKLWFTPPSAEVICLDIDPLRRGEGMPAVVWKLDMDAELGVFVHPMVMAWPGPNSVAIYDRWIYVNTDNAVDWTHVNIPAPFSPSLICLEKVTGKVVWEDNSPGTNILHIQWSSPLALNLDGQGRVIHGFGDGWLRSFAADSGQLLWELDCNPAEYRKHRYPAANGPSEILATPVFGKEPLHLDKQIVKRSALSDAAPSAKPAPFIWINHMHAPLYASPVYANGTLYWNADGYLCAIAPLTHSPEKSESAVRKRTTLPGAVFVPTPQDVVERMLEMARVTDKDQVVDLGSGDGRVVVTAARNYGSQSIGYELDPVLIERSLRTIQELDLQTLVRVEERDLFSVDLSTADVVVVFLPGSMMQKLLPQFQRLKPGARIVSHDFQIPGIPADETVRLISREDGAEHAIHLWTAPLQPRATP